MKYLHLLNATAASVMMALVVICMVVVCVVGAPLILLMIGAIKILSWLAQTASDSLEKAKGPNV